MKGRVTNGCVQLYDVGGVPRTSGSNDFTDAPTTPIVTIVMQKHAHPINMPSERKALVICDVSIVPFLIVVDVVPTGCCTDVIEEAMIVEEEVLTLFIVAAVAALMVLMGAATEEDEEESTGDNVSGKLDLRRGCCATGCGLTISIMRCCVCSVGLCLLINSLSMRRKRRYDQTPMTPSR